MGHPTIRGLVNDPATATATSLAGDPTPEPPPEEAKAPQGPVPGKRWPAQRLLVAALGVVAVAALGLAWNTRERLQAAEQELVKRQQGAADLATEARALSRQAEAVARENAAKIALLEARVSETSLQRTQLEELIQSLSRSRDENVLADVEAALRVAVQQSAITGSLEPLAASLRQADERLKRYPAARMERVRRAVTQDLERVRAASVVDLPSLTIRLDEVIRVVDELPLLATVDPVARRSGAVASTSASPGPASSAAARTHAASAPGAAASASRFSWPGWVDRSVQAMAAQFWDEVRSLLRVTRVDNPEAALLAPEQAFFLRENLKLRLLNARLALLSRQFDIAQADLREAQATLERYFDRSSRRVSLTSDTLRQVAAQSRQLVVPRPDATFAALAAVTAGR